jgi:hypothetical protein
MTDGTTVTGRRPEGGRKPKTYGDDRVCHEDGCTTRLSRYNRQQFCSSHARIRFPRVRGVELATEDA